MLVWPRLDCDNDDCDDGVGGDNGEDDVSEVLSLKLNKALLFLCHRSFAGVLDVPNNTEKNKKITKNPPQLIQSHNNP